MAILANRVIGALSLRVLAMYFEPTGSVRDPAARWGGAVLGITCAAALVLSFVVVGPIYPAVSRVGMIDGHP